MRLARFLFFLGCALPTVAFSQQLSDEQMLQSLYGQEQINQDETLSTSSDFLIFKNTQGHYVQDMNGIKDISSYPDILAYQPQIEGVEILTADLAGSEFWLGAYGIPVQPKHYGYYRIGDTGVLFIVYPQDLITVLYQKQNG
jgi:hypothetical protein